MQERSDVWKSLWRDPLHKEETKLVIAGVEYFESEIVLDSLKISGGMFSTLDIGTCASRQIDVELQQPKEAIPRQAKIEVFKRLIRGEETSEWMKQGVFFISTRETNKITGSLTLHGFDAMLKASAVWLTSDYAADNWPKTETEAAEDIAARMGTTLDKRTKLNNQFTIDYPVDENGDMTMMDILEGIATANAGNWVVTDAGELLLRRIGEEPEETNILVDEYGYWIIIGGVVINVG